MYCSSSYLYNFPVNLDRNPHKPNPPPLPNPFFLSPLTAPISADLDLHSLTKYINGHSDILMGAVILPTPSDAPNGNERYHQRAVFQTPIPTKCTHGAVPSAFDAWLVQRGAKTLALRMKAHATNAIALARFLLNRRKLSTQV